METAAKAGFQHIQFTTPTDEELAATIAYLKSLEPLPSPYLRADGSLTSRGQAGQSNLPCAHHTLRRLPPTTAVYEPEDPERRHAPAV
jgi:hypothetical protein